jgi:arylformamidase
MSAYQNLSRDELDREYDIEATVPDLAGLLDGFQARADKVKSEIPGQLDLAYGPDPLQALDAFSGDLAGAPILVFIHGGYWKGGDKGGRSFPAPLFNRNGIVWAPINYRLAPAATLDEIEDDARSALGWVYRNAETIGGDPERIYVAGTSAGGHLTGMLLAPGWHDAYDMPDNVVKGACAMSGLFDLSPFLHTSGHGYLGLDEASAARNSPIRHLPETGCPILIAWAGKETSEFRRQSADFADACRAAGCRAETLFLEDQDHFSLTGELAHAESPLARAVIGMIKAGG